MLASVMRPMLMTGLTAGQDLLTVGSPIKSPAAAAVVSFSSAISGFGQNYSTPISSPIDTARPRLNLRTLFGTADPESVPVALAELSPTSRNTILNSHISRSDSDSISIQVVRSESNSSNKSAQDSTSNGSGSVSNDATVDHPVFILAVHPGTPYPTSAIERLPNPSLPSSILKGSVVNMNAKRAHPAFPAKKRVVFSSEISVIDESCPQTNDCLTPSVPSSPFALVLSPRYPTSAFAMESVPEGPTFDRSLHPLRQARRFRHSLTNTARAMTAAAAASASASKREVSQTSTMSEQTEPAKKPRKHDALFASYAEAVLEGIEEGSELASSDDGRSEKSV